MTIKIIDDKNQEYEIDCPVLPPIASRLNLASGKDTKALQVEKIYIGCDDWSTTDELKGKYFTARKIILSCKKLD